MSAAPIAATGVRATALPRFTVLLATVAPALLAVAVRLAAGPHAIDDAYITFRYARNLAEGNGLVYNTGEPVLGTTTPLWAMILAAFYRLGLTDLPVVATTLAAFLDGGSAALLVMMARRLGYSAAGAGLVGAAWALNPMSVAYAAGGMETSLFVLAALGALGLAAKQRWVLAAAVAGSMVAIRPEGALIATAVVAWCGLRQPRHLPITTLSAALPIACYVIALYSTFGTVIPQTVLAKQVAYLTESPWLTPLILALQVGLPGWSTFFPASLPVALAFPLALAGIAATVVLGWKARTRLWSSGTWQPFAMAGALYLAFHVLGALRGGRLFPWYLVPLVPLYLLVVAAGLAAVLPNRRLWLGAAVLVLWQLPAISWTGTQPLLPVGFSRNRETVYRQVAEDLRTSYPSTTTIAAPEIGVLGYVSGLRVLDTVGLVSPVATRYYPLPPDQVEGDNAIPPSLILDEAPDLVVTLDQFARRSLLVDPRFEAAYKLDHAYPAPIWLSREVLVFKRLDTARTQ